MTPVEAGRHAEAVAADFLQRKGCCIIARNWRTARCEIDVVAQRQGVIYFCEVKYRTTSRQGMGMDYITPAKLRRMRFAAERWVYTHAWRGPYELCAIEISGPEFTVTAVVRDL